MKTVLFVCTGNSCRSVIAEGLLKKYVREHGRDDVRVVSAGVGTVDGLPPAPLAIEVMRREDADVSRFKTKVLTDDMVRSADLILVMEAFHKEEILMRNPRARGKTFLLKEFRRDTSGMSRGDLEVEDPIGHPVEKYEDCLAAIREEIKRIGKFL